MAYPFGKIEKKWAKKWLDSKLYEPDLKQAKKPYYNLMMFPYPSAEGLHVGNMYAFTGSDIYGRFQRMQGNDVFEPIGLDGFGIHSENYALKIGTHPAKQAKISEKNFYRQLQSIGNGFAWNERLETYDPEYYKWTQWIFIQLFKKGLAYRKKQSVNWCPSCKTVLADEQVIAGRCERCNTKVIKKDLEQWFFRITKYADRLLKGLDGLDWSEKIKIAQRNWIGKSQGAEIDFHIDRESSNAISYVMGVGDISEDLKKIDAKIEGRTESGSFKVTFPRKNTGEFEKLIIDKLKPGFWNEYITDEVIFIFKDKKGKTKRIVWNESEEAKLLELCNEYAKANFQNIRGMLEKNDWYNGRVDNFVKVFTTRPDTIFGATYMVLAPEHPLVKKLESRIKNLEEVKKYLKKAKAKTDEDRIAEGKSKTGIELKGIKVVNPATKKEIPIWVADYVLGHVGTGAIMAVPAHDERDLEFAKKFKLPIIKSKLVDKDEIIKQVGGRKMTQYRLRDWLISRQRYWGPPIPMIYCEKCDWQPVLEKDLPVKLPAVKNFRPAGKGKSPLASVKSFYETKCPQCGGKAKRETDVSDTFLDSSWYFFRYLDVKNKTQLFEKQTVKKWLPVSAYIGGAEHAVLHLLYSRFITMVFKDMGLISFDEPYSKFRAHGLLISEGAKMSKSKGNVVIPDEYIKKFGADVVRTYLMFIGPFEQGGDWRDAGIMGPVRFLDRVWTLGDKISEAGSRKPAAISNWFHASIKEITKDVNELKYNTAISGLMTVLNKLAKGKQIKRKDWESFLLMLAPFAPFITEELWKKLGNKYSIHKQPWPKHDTKYLIQDTFTLVVQVNGKLRAQIPADRGITQKETEKLALADSRVQKFTAGKKIRKTIFVKDKLINFVV